MNDKDNQLNKNLRFLNMQNVELRRGANKIFLNCLIGVYEDLPSALLWLKTNIDFDVCYKIMSDWEYTGQL